MSEQPLNAFIGLTEEPTDADLDRALGPLRTTWDHLIHDLADEQGVAELEWSSYSVKKGWALKLKRGKRTIVWMSPCAGCILVAFILGDKAVQDARKSSLSQRVLHLLDEAPRYPEGTGLRMYLKSSKDLAAVKKLAAIKLPN